MILRLIACITLCIFATTASAMFCPSNFNQINVGDSMDLVARQCGAPASVKQTKSEDNQPQEWTYYEQIPSDPFSGVANIGTLKVTFAFADGKVINMTSNGIGVGASTICNDQTIQLGSSIQDVKKACGKYPALVTKTNLQGETATPPPPIEKTEWLYSSSPPVTLIFENKLLTERVQQ